MDSVNANLNNLKFRFDTTVTSMNELKLAFETHKKASEEKIASLESAVDLANQKYEEQLAVNEALKEDVKILYKKADEQESYSRRNCLLLHGIPELENERSDDVFLENINNKLNLNLVPSDLDRSHRLGRKKTEKGKHRPIIVKFARHNVKANVYRKKKLLKGTNILLTESLSRRRVNMLNAARDKWGKLNVWTNDAEIFAKIGINIVNVTNQLY